MPPVRRPDPDAVRLPPALVGPVDVEPTRAVEEIPGPNELPGGSRYEPKFHDGLETWRPARHGSADARSFLHALVGVGDAC